MIGAGLIVSIAEEGGLGGPDFAMNSPEFALYADGRLIEPVALPTVYPGPLLPSLHQVEVSPAGIQHVMALAHSDGLADHDQRYVATTVEDAADTLITVVLDGRAVTGRFTALGGSTATYDPAEAAARAGALDFVTSLRGNSGFFGSDQVGPEAQYVPLALELVAVQGNPGAGVQPSELVPAAIAWPLSTPLGEFGSSLAGAAAPTARCGVVSGPDLAVLWPVLQAATQLTAFTSNGATWTLTPQPLLPGEPGSCGSTG